VSQFKRRGATAAAVLLWLLSGSCLNPRPDDLPAGAENAANENGTPVNDLERPTDRGPEPAANAPAASGADAPPAEDTPSFGDATISAPAPQDAGVPPAADAGPDAN